VAVWIEPTVSYVGATAESALAEYGKEGYGEVKVFFLETIKGKSTNPHVSSPF